MYSIKVYKSNGSKTEHNVSSLDIATIKKEIGISDDDVVMVRAHIEDKPNTVFHIGKSWQYFVTYEFIDGLTDSDVIYVEEGQNPIQIAKQNMPFLAHDVEVEIM